MKTAIVYVSTHHGNTKKLLDAISANHEVTLIDGTKEKEPDLNGYDCIGFASGIAYSNFYPQAVKIMESCLPKEKKVFFLYTCGNKMKGYTKAVTKIAEDKNCTVLGQYGCLGFDTFGPFKLLGGIAKGHPTDREIDDAVKFFDSILKEEK